MGNCVSTSVQSSIDVLVLHLTEREALGEPTRHETLAGWSHGAHSRMCWTIIQRSGGRDQDMDDAFKRILKAEGPMGLYTGLAPRLARVAPGQAITWIAVEYFNSLCNKQKWLE